MNKETFITENAYGEDKSSLNYWKNHRNKLDDLYPSERYFLYPILKSTKSVLDAGCAAGGSFDFCREAKSNIDYTGIDISKKLINIANKLHPKGFFFVYDGHKITFKEKKFDLVFSIGVLHHLHHWRGMIKQMVKCSSSSTIFDIRLTNEETLDNAKKYYQYVTFDDMRKSKTAIAAAAPSQTLRPSDAPIPTSTKAETMVVKRRTFGLQSLQKMSEIKKGKQSSKKPP